MSSLFKATIEQYPFSNEGVATLKDQSKHGEDWPVVYILSGSKEAYVGETQNAYGRMNQHLANRKTKRRNLTKINLMQSEAFNKSAILDIENMLITHMHADGKFILQNGNGGQSKLHNYYQRSEYQNVFYDIWEKLKKINIVDHEIFEIQNTDIFKFSPYKELTADQYQIVESLLHVYVDAMKGDTRTDVVVKGGAGTGKSLIGIYFINMIANILSNNYDYSDTDELDDESLYNRSELIKNIKEFGNTKIGFVVAVPSFKDTVKKVFHSIKELKRIQVVSPSEASRGDFDVLIVDEAHRLKRRNKLTNYGTHDNVNRALGLPLDSTELDWLKLKAKKLLVMFYDDKQSVKESYVERKDFLEIENNPKTKYFYLTAQLRVKGGNEYIDFINNLFTDKPDKYLKNEKYDIKIFDDCHAMMEAIVNKNSELKGLCRMLSGLSFHWRGKVRDKASTTYTQDYDFEIDGYHYCWNEGFNPTNFITNDENVRNIGCVYTCQGHDLNYAGVILGPDISYDSKTKKIVYHPDKFNDTYSRSNDIEKTIANIINAYKVLLTRGMYGTYIYAVDENLREYLKSKITE